MGADAEKESILSFKMAVWPVLPPQWCRCGRARSDAAPWQEYDFGFTAHLLDARQLLILHGQHSSGTLPLQQRREERTWNRDISEKTCHTWRVFHFESLFKF